MPTFRLRRASACIALVLAVAPLFAGSASASSLVQERFAQRRHLQQRIEHVRRSGSDTARRLQHESVELTRGLNVISPRSMSGRWRQVRRGLGRQIRRLKVASRRVDHGSKERVRQLQGHVRSISTWLRVWGVFRTCPVAGPHVVNNDFGIIVRMPGVPVHVHQGNDITAAAGTPIVAPFDGTAVTSANALGGLAVKVYGSRGYVYNAHLSSYGHLGAVRAGEVIGYVGTTGDASGPHDHFEWHPNNGPAVDPNALLSVVC